MTHPLQQSMPLRTVHQIVDREGNACATTITSNLWVSDPGRFADPREGNKVQAFVTGKAYFADLLKEIATAKSQILIAGWQVNWDALLAPGVRLYDALYQAAEKNPALKIYVMPWHDREPVQTYDDQTAAALQVINKRLGRKQIFVFLSSTYATKDAGYYSHHQKQVVIDGRIAYVGGIDLAYGRYCDEHYTLKADADGRHGLNRYNPCVAQVGEMPQRLCADPDLLSGALDKYTLVQPAGFLVQPVAQPASNAAETAQNIHGGAWQPKYEEAGKLISGSDASKLAQNKVDATTLDPARQPRMPWQDVHCRIEGPAVSDLMRNFIDRWNIEPPDKQRLDPPPPPSSFAKAGNAHIQVLRSAPTNQCGKEYNQRRYKAEAPTPIGTQADIYQAMCKLIEKSRRFIYIENQFFVSDFGKEAPCPEGLSPAARYIDQYEDKNQNSWARRATYFNSESDWKLSGTIDYSRAMSSPRNRIVRELLARIARSALSGAPFHVYITLPIHPEGCLSSATVAVQVYWTMQTISFGSHSLLNGVRRIIKARELLQAKDRDYERVFKVDNKEYESIGMEACGEFVTLMNLRNWAKLGDRYVTEQIYVHSKTMIVDDLYALIGSANINDRSLLGERDSELAVLVMDGDTLDADVHGESCNRVVRKFAHELRMALWRKIFGLADCGKSADDIERAIDHPGDPASWELMRQRAAQNAKLYEAAFRWIPRDNSRNSDGSIDDGHILPAWDSSLPSPKPDLWLKGDLSMPMPFQSNFWSNSCHTSIAKTKMDQIKGFVVALPVNWVRGENNRFEYPIALVANNELSDENTLNYKS